jgi:hypothetical protein
VPHLEKVVLVALWFGVDCELDLPEFRFINHLEDRHELVLQPLMRRDEFTHAHAHACHNAHTYIHLFFLTQRQRVTGSSEENAWDYELVACIEYMYMEM